MKTRFRYFIQTYLLFVLAFVVQKPLFMLYHVAIYKDAAWNDWFKVAFHGLPLDLSLAGYLSALPGLLLIATIWSRGKLWRRLAKAYFAAIALLLSAVFVIDLGLYSYWGFRLDATPLFYFLSSPADALASVSSWMVAGGIAAWLLIAAALYALFVPMLRNNTFERKPLPLNRPFFTILFTLLWAALFVPIRGGFTVSTMNIGKVYFSNDLRLNHAATNPLFSLMTSLSRQNNFRDQYRFMDDAKAQKIVARMLDPDVTTGTYQPPKTWILTTSRPNVLIVVLESFSAHIMASLGGKEGVAPNMDRLAKEGLLFRQFYATSFRTDRGLVSILGGFPSMPTTSVMKQPKVSQALPSIAQSLRQAGYTADYYYGGDADFANMRSYLMASGFGSITSDRDFPINQRLGKWGAHDHLLFNRLLSVLRTADSRQPWFKVVQTSSSHEPYDVPFHRLDDKVLNAFAYTDSCVGRFVRQFKQLPQWKNTLVVLVADHQGSYPPQIDNLSVARYHIPLLLLGGALNTTGAVDTYGSQADIAATLLGQMGIGHRAFTFSKDMFNPASPHFAFFTFPDAFGMVDEHRQTVFNNEANALTLDKGPHSAENLQRGKAYLQEIYNTVDRLSKQPGSSARRPSPAHQ